MKSKFTAPCQADCPVRTDAGGYARLVAEGRYQEAYEVVCRTNPFPSVCGHICQRLCEKNCRRGQIDAAVGLRALKRFLVAQAALRGRPLQPVQQPDKSPVAVVGAGPAGLTAAYDLRRLGHAVTVFERLDRPGGMLNVIPRYRLPQAALSADIEAILGAGIELKCGQEIGRDFTVTALLERGYQAVVVATGLSRSRGIAVPGLGGQRFTAAIPWMMDVWMGNKVEVGRRVLVVGGGNVAADVARTARRLGADDVTMVCLESWEEIPAEPEEIRLAMAEGIHILPRHALKRVFNQNGHIVAVELMSVVSVFDEMKRFRPTYDPSRIRTVSTDMVILSAGQTTDRSWARGSPVQTDDRGRVVVDRNTHVTSQSRVFLAGESLRGPGSAIAAVADGHRVASVVARFLETGQVVAPLADEVKPLESFPPDVLQRLRRIEPLAKGEQPFGEPELPLTEEDAVAEGGRCLGCLAGAVVDEAKCAACLTCVRVCPLDAISVREAAVPNPVRCQACGLCASVCPAGAIRLACAGPLKAGEPPLTGTKTVVLRCRHSKEEDAEGRQTIHMPCVARLKPSEVLQLVKQGWQTVEIRACSSEQCKYGAAWKNIQVVVDYVRNILSRVQPTARVELYLPHRGPEGQSPQETQDDRR